MSNHKNNLLKNFISVLGQLEGGRLQEELSEEMRSCIQEISDACLDRGGTHKASLTLKLDFIMNQQDKIVEVKADVVKKIPKAPRGRAGVYWCDSEGNLTRENPRQLHFDDEIERRRQERQEKADNMGGPIVPDSTQAETA